MRWFWNKEEPVPYSPAGPPPTPEEDWGITLVAVDGKEYWIFPIPKSKLVNYAYEMSNYGAQLNQNGEPVLFVPGPEAAR